MAWEWNREQAYELFSSHLQKPGIGIFITTLTWKVGKQWVEKWACLANNAGKIADFFWPRKLKQDQSDKVKRSKKFDLTWFNNNLIQNVSASFYIRTRLRWVLGLRSQQLDKLGQRRMQPLPPPKKERWLCTWILSKHKICRYLCTRTKKCKQ